MAPSVAPPTAQSLDRPASYLDLRPRLLAVAASLGLLAFALEWYRFASYRSLTMDLAVFDQALWKLAHGHAPQVTVIGWNVFADHLSPVLFLFVPLYRLAATPLWLFLAQSLAFGAGFLAVPALLRAADVDTRLQPGFLFAYAATPLLWNALLVDFHPTTLAVPFLVVGLTAALRHDLRMLALMSVALLLIRDDLGLAVAAMALAGWSAAPSSHHRRRRVALALGGLAWVLVGGAVGSALGANRHWVPRYGYLAATPGDALLHPWRTLPRLVLGLGRVDNLTLVVICLGTLAFLPVLSPRRLLLAGLLALPFLTAEDANLHTLRFHYEAPVLPFLLLAAATGVSRLSAERARAAGRVLVPAFTVVVLVALGPLDTRSLTDDTVVAGDARRALSYVGPSDRVVADDQLAPHLSQRDFLLPYPYPFAAASQRFPIAASVARVSPEVAATIDAVAVAALHRPTPELAGFTAHRYGTVVIYRRTGDAS
jgi:uncharacterized membrane protein